LTLKESYTKNKMGGHPERHITDPRNTRLEETIEDRRMEASSEGGLGPEGAVTPWTDGEENT
jgi:hypothetical protein